MKYSGRVGSSWIHFIFVLVLLPFPSSHAGDKKGKCGVQVVAIEQIKYKPIPVEIIEKSAIKYEKEPPPSTYSPQATTAAPNYVATTTPAPMPKPTSTTSKKMDITEMIKEMYGPPPQKPAPPTPPPAPQIYVMPAPAPSPPKPHMVYMMAAPAPAPPTRLPKYSMIPQMMQYPMMMPQAPYMMQSPQPPRPRPQQPMMMNMNYDQMMGVVVENQPPANAMVYTTGNAVTENNYAPVLTTTTTVPAVQNYGQGVATPAPQEKSSQLDASSSEDEYGNSQHLVSFPQMSGYDNDYDMSGHLNGPISGMNVNNQMRPYQEMSSQVKEKYGNRMKDNNNEESEEEDELYDNDDQPIYNRKRQKPVDVVMGYRVRPQSHHIATSRAPDPTFRDILMSKLTNSFSRRSSGSQSIKSDEKIRSKNEADGNNKKVMNQLRLRSQIEQTLDQILFNT